jgi:hypothetical protein
MNCVEAKVSKGDAGTAGAADDDKKRKSGTNLGGVTFVEDKRLRACDALVNFAPRLPRSGLRGDTMCR